MNRDPIEFIAHRRESDGVLQSVNDHLFGVAALARSFAERIGLGAAGEVLGLLHDLGKFSAAFQSRINDANPERVDHSTAGAQLIWNESSPTGDHGAIAGQFLALCVASHHGGLIDCITPDGEGRFAARMRKPDVDVHLRESLDRAGAIAERARSILQDASSMAGLRNALERIARTERERSVEGAEGRFALSAGLLLRFLFSCLIDADRTDTANFERPNMVTLRSADSVDWPVLAHRLERHLAALADRTPIDGLRRSISEKCREAAARPKGLFTLSVPTGGGKTLASLRFAIHHAIEWECSRIVYIAPYTSILDQNAQVARDILEGRDAKAGSVVLEHHSNLTSNEDTAQTKLLAENWDAPVVFTTMVQFLETVFGGGTRGARRLHRLSDAVLIFDEIQTLPVKAVHLFCNAVHFLVQHCGATALLSTATQPLLGKVDRVKGALALGAANELMDDVPGTYRSLRRVEVVDLRRPEGWAIEAVAELARGVANRAGSCLVIVNTKRAARELYLASRRHGGPRVFHLSTDMCPAHRGNVLAEIVGDLGDSQRGHQVLCISTQLIEAGVDIDFGGVIRFAAGLDSIAQAAGRCNRHGLRATGEVVVVNPRDENLGSLDEIRAGRDAGVRVLDEFATDPPSLGDDLLSPMAIERYFEYWFFDRRREMDYPVHVERNDTILNLLSLNDLSMSEHRRRHGIDGPRIFLRQAFSSAGRAFRVIDEASDAVIVPYSEGANLIGELLARSDVIARRAMLRRAQRFSVSLRPTTLARLKQRGAIRELADGLGVFYLDSRYYSNDTGVSEDAVSPAPVHVV